jgi:hypothetical protein
MKMMKRIILVAFGLVLCVCGASAADYVIKKDRGGNPSDYWNKYVAVRNSGDRVVIDGVCGSACTVVIQVMPRERICVTRNASLAFHAARFKGTQVVHDELTAMYFKKSPPDFQKWMTANNALESLEVKVLRGSELETFIQRCPPPLY